MPYQPQLPWSYSGWRESLILQPLKECLRQLLDSIPPTLSDRFQQFVASLERPSQRLTVGNLLGQEMSQGDPEK